MTAGGIRRRFLILRGFRWLPTGLAIPVLVLLLVDRGFSLGQIGLATAAQGLLVLVLELPTGGLADTWGRRRILLAAGMMEVVAIGLLVATDTMAWLVTAFAIMGVYRALESGPLDAWYVDTAQAVDAEADIEGGLAAGGVMIGLAISAGTMLSAGLVAWRPVAAVPPLVTPLLLMIILRIVELGAIAGLMVKPTALSSATTIRRTLSATVAGVSTVVGQALSTVRGSRALTALVVVELLWGFGMISFEVFTPARLDAVLGDPDQAATILGPANAVAWLASAAAAGLVPSLTRRLGAATSGAALRVAQGLTVVGIALVAGPLGVVTAYVLTMAVHGASNPVHLGLLNRAVDDPTQRATVLSANSLSAQLGGAAGGIALGALADATSLRIAILAGASVLAAAAPLYLVVRRAQPALVSTLR